jgi:hypothetical protein
MVLIREAPGAFQQFLIRGDMGYRPDVFESRRHATKQDLLVFGGKSGRSCLDAPPAGDAHFW